MAEAVVFHSPQEALEQLLVSISAQDTMFAWPDVGVSPRRDEQGVDLLPLDVLAFIFSKLDELPNMDLMRAMAVCRRWRAAGVSEPGLWSRLDFSMFPRVEDEDVVRAILRAKGQVGFLSIEKCHNVSDVVLEALHYSTALEELHAGSRRITGLALVALIKSVKSAKDELPVFSDAAYLTSDVERDERCASSNKFKSRPLRRRLRLQQPPVDDGGSSSRSLEVRSHGGSVSARRGQPLVLSSLSELRADGPDLGIAEGGEGSGESPASPGAPQAVDSSQVILASVGRRRNHLKSRAAYRRTMKVQSEQQKGAKGEGSGAGAEDPHQLQMELLQLLLEQGDYQVDEEDAIPPQDDFDEEEEGDGDGEVSLNGEKCPCCREDGAHDEDGFGPHTTAAFCPESGAEAGGSGEERRLPQGTCTTHCRDARVGDGAEGSSASTPHDANELAAGELLGRSGSLGRVSSEDRFESAVPPCRSDRRLSSSPRANGKQIVDEVTRGVDSSSNRWGSFRGSASLSMLSTLNGGDLSSRWSMDADGLETEGEGWGDASESKLQQEFMERGQTTLLQASSKRERLALEKLWVQGCPNVLSSHYQEVRELVGWMDGGVCQHCNVVYPVQACMDCEQQFCSNCRRFAQCGECGVASCRQLPCSQLTSCEDCTEHYCVDCRLVWECEACCRSYCEQHLEFTQLCGIGLRYCGKCVAENRLRNPIWSCIGCAS